MARRLRFATMLSPLLFPTYAAVVEELGRRTGHVVQLETLSSSKPLAEGAFAGAFLCGRQYVELVERAPGCVELLGAPVLRGQRYHGRPCYFADLVVRANQPLTTLQDLRGARLAYNEVASHSGYSLVRAKLLSQGLDWDFFGGMVATGSHLHSLELVASGSADAVPVDAQILDVLRFRRAASVAGLRVLTSFGPSPVPPLVVGGQLPEALRHTLREALLSMHEDAAQQQRLHAGRIARFAAVQDHDYDPLRRMLTQCRQTPEPGARKRLQPDAFLENVGAA